MGALYVVEGSTLGGAVLSRHFAERFGVSRDHGLAFFNVYGDRTGEMWQRYLAALVEYDNAGDAERVIAAAKATFVSLADWLTAPAEAEVTPVSMGAATR
jgi:heme oxygenase